jgi:hypothetical protein
MRAAGRGLGLVARVIGAIAVIVFFVIAIGILLLLLGANQGNAVVQAVTDAARWLAGPFNGLFTLGDGTTSTALNWGIAAIVYLIVGALIAGLLRRMGAAGRTRRSRRARA